MSSLLCSPELVCPLGEESVSDSFSLQWYKHVCANINKSILSNDTFHVTCKRIITVHDHLLFHSLCLESVSALTSQVKVADRPMTQQGLGGLKTAGGLGVFILPSLSLDQMNHIDLSPLSARAVQFLATHYSSSGLNIVIVSFFLFPSPLNVMSGRPRQVQDKSYFLGLLR